MNKFIRLSTRALWIMALLCSIPSAVAQVITATISITNNVPITNGSGAWIAIQGSRLTWTNRSVAALWLNTRAISATNPPSYAATNLSNKLRLLFTPSLAFGWNNATAIVVRAGQGKSLSISNSDGWMSLSLDTSTPSYSTWPATFGASNVQGVAFTLGGSTIYNWTDIGGGPTSGVTAQIATNIALSQAQVVAATNIPPINVNVITNTQATGQISSVTFNAGGATTPDSLNAGEMTATNMVSTVVTGIRIYGDDFYGTLHGQASSAETTTFAVTAGSASQLGGDNGNLFLQAPGGVAGSFNAGALTNNHPAVIGTLPANARSGEFRDTGTNLFIGSTNANGGAVVWKEIVTTTNNHSAGKIPVGQGDGNIAWLDTNAIAGTGVSDGDKANITVADSGASYVVRSNTVPFNFLSNTPTASASLSGILSATDWTTFNNKQPGNANTTNWSLFTTNILSLRQPADADLTNWANTATGIVLHASAASALYQPLDGDLSAVAALGIGAFATNGGNPTFGILTAATQYLGQVISTNFSVLSNSSPTLPPNHAAMLWRSNANSLFVIQNNGGTYYTNLAIVPDGVLTNLQSGVSLSNSTLHGNLNGNEIRVNSFRTGMNTNGTPAIQMVGINSNVFSVLSLLNNQTGDYLLTNIGGNSFWVRMFGGNVTAASWASNSGTDHVMIRIGSGVTATNSSFESGTPWKLSTGGAAGAATNISSLFFRNFTNGPYSSQASPSNFTAQIGSVATFTPTLTTLDPGMLLIKTNVVIATSNIPFAPNNLLTLITSNTSFGNAIQIYGFANGSRTDIQLRNDGGIITGGYVAIAQPVSASLSLNNYFYDSSMVTIVPDVNIGLQIPIGAGVYPFLTHWEAFNNNIGTNIYWQHGYVYSSASVETYNANKQLVWNYLSQSNWPGPVMRFIGIDDQNRTNGFWGISTSNSVFRLSALNPWNDYANAAYAGTMLNGLSMNTNGHVTLSGALTITTNATITAPPMHSMTLWNSNGINLWLIKNSAGTLVTNLLN